MKITTQFSGSSDVTGLDGWSIQTFLRGEKDSKQTDEIQASHVSPLESTPSTFRVAKRVQRVQ